jgi:hypothetical protein
VHRCNAYTGDDMGPLRNIRQELFCQEYVKDGNGTRSAKAAGYRCSTDGAAAVCAVQVLRSTKVQDPTASYAVDIISFGDGRLGQVHP